MKRTWLIIGGVAAALLLAGGTAAVVVDVNAPRGISNNNPGNIRISAYNWNGKIPADKRTDQAFEQFTEMKYGVRAAIINLRNYIKTGWNTPNDIIVNWSEGSWNEYLRYVQDVAGFSPSQQLTFDYATIKLLLAAIFGFENGGQKWANQALATYDAAWALI